MSSNTNLENVNNQDNIVINQITSDSVAHDNRTLYQILEISYYTNTDQEQYVRQLARQIIRLVNDSRFKSNNTYYKYLVNNYKLSESDLRTYALPVRKSLENTYKLLKNDLLEYTDIVSIFNRIIEFNKNYEFIKPPAYIDHNKISEIRTLSTWKLEILSLIFKMILRRKQELLKQIKFESPVKQPPPKKVSIFDKIFKRGRGKKITYNGAIVFTVLIVILIISMITSYNSYPKWFKIVSPMLLFIFISCASAVCISVKKELSYSNSIY